MFGFSWLAEKIKITNKQGIRLIVVKVEIVEIFGFHKLGRKSQMCDNNRICCYVSFVLLGKS